MKTIKFEASLSINDEITDKEIKDFLLSKLISNGFDCIEVKKIH